jgi:Dolichyl-phosphate-mannose-protein mannosyltransferase
VPLKEPPAVQSLDLEAMPMRRQLTWLLAALALWAGLRLAFGTSISGNDDISIATCALNMLQKGWQVPATHYCGRFGLILPIAAIFGMFGTGAAQLSVLPAIASFASVLLAWRLGSLLMSPTAGIAAAFAFAVFPMDVEMAGLLFPDLIQGALLAGSILCLLQGRDRGWGWPVAAGLLWGWAYYVKVDAAILVFVIGLLWLLGFISLRAAIIAGLTAFAAVGIELLAYGVLIGDPIYRLHLESIAANEVLAAGRDYRQLLTYPKAMFLVPYEAGLFFYVWLLGLGFAVLTRHRGALFVAGWSLIWLLWLMFGADPFSGFRLKAQLTRYLLSMVVPVAVLVGWTWTVLWERVRVLAWAMPAAMLAAVALFAPFNRLSFEGPAATYRALTTAMENRWYPLCADLQSMVMLRVLLYGKPEAAELCVVQEHDFLKGQTTFRAPNRLPAYFLLNDVYARRLQDRNLVQPIDPARFGSEAKLVWQVDNPLPGSSYAALEILRRASALVPVPGLRQGIANTAAEIGRTGDAKIWRVDGTPRAP